VIRHAAAGIEWWEAGCTFTEIYEEGDTFVLVRALCHGLPGEEEWEYGFAVRMLSPDEIVIIDAESNTQYSRSGTALDAK
jgi:hypothetical protein